ncbi:MAG: hypothetical protein ACREDR_24805 [Blastocatellia bacterium]
MKSRLSLIALYVVLVGGTYYASPGERSKPYDDRWVKLKVDELVRAAHAAFENDDALPRYQKILNSITRTIRERKLLEDEKFSSRYPEFLGYVQTISIGQLPDHELGFMVPDKEYFAETSQYVQIPDFLLNQGFLRSVSRFETLNRAKAYLRRLNSERGPEDQLIFFSYESRHLGTPDNDNSFRRLLIVVPGNPKMNIPEKWVQFGVTDPGARIRIRNVSVVSAVINTDGTFDTYFKDSFRTFHRDGSISIKGRWELGYGDDNCALCHKSGVLPIFPEDGSVPPGEEPAVLAVNQRFMTYGSPRFGKYLDGTKLGPGLSSASEQNRNRRFGALFGKSVVGESMTCSNCHQHEGLGALNWPMDPVLIGSYVKGGQMPMGRKLTDGERGELYEKLIQEYFATSDANPGVLKSWLLGRSR